MTPEPPAPVGVTPNPSTLRAAVALILLEAAGAALLTAYLAWRDLTGAARDIGVAIGVTLFALLATVVLASVGRALARRRSGARGPAVVLQLMIMVVGYYMAQSPLTGAGIALIALGLVTGGLIVSPPTTRALGLH